MDLHEEGVIILRLFLATLIGGLIGAEREAQNQAAGLRTQILVCVGSALLMMTSIEIFRRYGAGDPGRIAAQVVSGIGFLGAGTIMVRGITIKGLTTAASLWVNAAIGLALGMGYYTAGLTAAFLLLTALYVLGRWESRWLGTSYKTLLLYGKDAAKMMSEMDALAKTFNLRLQSVHIEPQEGKGVMGKYRLFVPYDLDHRALFDALTELSVDKAVYEGRVVLEKAS